MLHSNHSHTGWPWPVIQPGLCWAPLSSLIYLPYANQWTCWIGDLLFLFTFNNGIFHINFTFRSALMSYVIIRFPSYQTIPQSRVIRALLSGGLNSPRVSGYVLGKSHGTSLKSSLNFRNTPHKFTDHSPRKLPRIPLIVMFLVHSFIDFFINPFPLTLNTPQKPCLSNGFPHSIGTIE